MFALKRRLEKEYKEKGNTAEWQQDFRIWFIESHYTVWNMPYILAPNSNTRAEIKRGITEDFHSGYDLDKLVDMLCDEACKKPEPPTLDDAMAGLKAVYDYNKQHQPDPQAEVPAPAVREAQEPQGS